jgi:signal peptidase I
MSFELILVIVTAITGVIVFIDKMFWKSKRDNLSEDKKEPIIIEYSRSLFPVFLIVLVLRSFVLEPFKIPSASMYPTLQVGDFIVVNKFVYGVKLPVIQLKILPISLPKRGDVVVFKFPDDPSVDYIKRVIGIPGDKITYSARIVYVNDKPLKQKEIGRYQGTGSAENMTGVMEIEETFLSGKTHSILIDRDKFNHDMVTIIVPEGHYFVMGDNRDYSNDSRFWGFVPEKNLKGKAFGIWMNWDEDVEFSRIGSGIN